MARLRTIPMNARTSMRAGFCLIAPLIVGIIVDQRVPATLVAIGSLWTVSQDGVDRWGERSLRLLSVAACAGGGFLVGGFAREWLLSNWSLWLFLAAMALIAGFVETTSRPAPGMYLLLGAIVGSALKVKTLTWQPGLYVALGGIWVWGVALLMDRRSRKLDERLCVADAYVALAQLLRLEDGSSVLEARARALNSLDVAQDVLSSPRHSREASREEADALQDCFVVALQIGELSSVLRRQSLLVDETTTAALDNVGQTLRYQSAVVARVELEALAVNLNTRGITLAQRYLSKALFPYFHKVTMMPVLGSVKERLPLRDRFRFSVLLGSGVVAASLVTYQLDSPHAFWLPLSVAFILRPDLGPVIPRAFQRTLGTLAGVAIAAVVSWLGNNTYSLLVLCAAMAAVIPWASRRSHALTVMAFTPIVFVFLAVIGPDQYLFVPRIVDTTLAAAIVLLIDIVLWSRAPALRPAQQIQYADFLTRRYETSDTSSDPQRRHQQRRNALRAVARARSSLRQASAEPHPLRRPNHQLAEQLDAVQRRIDERTAAIVIMAFEN
jgi:uncharacterized membrane protein YccC